MLHLQWIDLSFNITALIKQTLRLLDSYHSIFNHICLFNYRYNRNSKEMLFPRCSLVTCAASFEQMILPHKGNLCCLITNRSYLTSSSGFFSARGCPEYHGNGLCSNLCISCGWANRGHEAASSQFSERRKPKVADFLHSFVDQFTSLKNTFSCLSAFLSFFGSSIELKSQFMAPYWQSNN